MLKTFVHLDLSSFIEVKLADSYSKIKMVGSKNDLIIWVNSQELNHGHKAAKRLSLFRPMEFSINFDTVSQDGSSYILRGSLVTISPKKLYIVFF